MIKNSDFKYLIEATHKFLQDINRRCLSFKEAKNVIDGIEAIGYIVELYEIKTNDLVYKTYNDLEESQC